MSAATKSMQKTPLETLGFKTSSFADKSCHLNPAKAGNWRISINAAAALGDGRDLLFYRGDVPPAGNFLPIAAERFTVVSAGFQPRCGVKTGTLPRNHLASSATGGASAVSKERQQKPMVSALPFCVQELHPKSRRSRELTAFYPRCRCIVRVKEIAVLPWGIRMFRR